MSFSHSTLGYLVSDLQKRIQAYWSRLSGDFQYVGVYLFSPIHDQLSLKVLLAVAIWVTISMLCLCWMKGHATDDTCICNNLGLRKKRLLANTDGVKKGPLLANPPRRFCTPLPDANVTVDASNVSESVLQSDPQESLWNSYSSGATGGFSVRIPSGSGSTQSDSSFAGNASLPLSDPPSYYSTGFRSSSWVIPSAASPWSIRESSTTRSFRDDDSSIATTSSQSDASHEVKEATPELQILDGQGRQSGTDRPFATVGALLTDFSTSVQPSINANTTFNNDCPADGPLPATPAQQRALSASPQTVSVSRIMAEELGRSQIMDESLGSFVVPPTPTPCSTSMRRESSPLDSLQLDQITQRISSFPDGIHITVTSHAHDGPQIHHTEATEPQVSRFPEEQMLSANSAAVPNPIVTPGRGRAPSFIPLPVTPIENVQVLVPKCPLAENTNMAQPQQKEKHWRKKKGRGQASSQAPAESEVQVHSAERPNWATAPVDVPLIKRIQVGPSEPLFKRIQTEPSSVVPLINRIQMERPPATFEPALVSVKVEPVAAKLESVDSVPNWAAVAAADSAAPGDGVDSEDQEDNTPSANPRKRKSRIVIENGRWKRGSWLRGPYAGSTRKSKVERDGE